jgi:hypothetical protein
MIVTNQDLTEGETEIKNSINKAIRYGFQFFSRENNFSRSRVKTIIRPIRPFVS